MDGIADPVSRLQVETLDKNAKHYGLTYFNMNDKRQGIVHVIGPEQGATLPGMTVVCGDSHTSTHGAFGALAHGIGTSEVEHVMATQTLLAKKAKNMLVYVDGKLAPGLTGKDIVLAIIGKIGTAGGTATPLSRRLAIRALSMEGRMTVCNMASRRRARRHHRRRRHTIITSRPSVFAGRSALGTRRAYAHPAFGPGRRFDLVVTSMRPRSCRRTWGTSPEWWLASMAACPTPTWKKTASSAMRWKRRSCIWP